MESDLTKSQKKNEKIIVELIKETEEYLHKTYTDRRPPYTPTYLFGQLESGELNLDANELGLQELVNSIEATFAA